MTLGSHNLPSFLQYKSIPQEELKYTDDGVSPTPQSHLGRKAISLTTLFPWILCVCLASLYVITILRISTNPKQQCYGLSKPNTYINTVLISFR